MSVPSVVAGENGSMTTSMRSLSFAQSFSSISGCTISSRETASWPRITSWVVIEPETSASTAKTGRVCGLKVSSHSGCSSVIARATAMITRKSSNQPMMRRHPLRRHAMKARPTTATTNATPTAKASGVGLKTSCDEVGCMPRRAENARG